MKKLLLLGSALFLLVLTSQAAFAIPALQIYIPDATWDASTQTWVTGESDFELWVIAANTDSKPIYNLTLCVALMGETPTPGALTIDGTDYDSFVYGTPPSWGGSAGDYPPHSIYPTNYVEMSVADLVDTYPETVHNMQPGQFDDMAPGKIFKFDVSTTYDMLHFDAYGFHNDYDGHFKFVPNSHDGEKGRIPPPNIPEPSTLLLFGSALVAAGGIKRFGKK